METNFNKDNLTKLFEMAGWAVTVALQVSQLFRLGVQNILHKTRDELMSLAAMGQRPTFAAPVKLLSSEPG